jgi:hypothetical protein
MRKPQRARATWFALYRAGYRLHRDRVNRCWWLEMPDKCIGWAGIRTRELRRVPETAARTWRPV